MADRDLFELLGVAELERPFASLVAWLLNPAASHRRGDALQQRLASLLKAAGVTWSPSPSTPPELSRRGEECALLVPGEPALVVVHRLRREGSLELNLHAGEQLVCLGAPRAFPPELSGSFPLWAYDEVLEVLKASPAQGPHADLQDALQARLERLLHPPQRETSVLPAELARAALGEEEGTESVDLAELQTEMLLSDDMSRAYIVEARLGRGAQGSVYQIAIQGNQEFPALPHPVKVAALKLAHGGAAASLERELRVYQQGLPGVVRLLDRGQTGRGSPYLVLERLYPHPAQIYELFDPASVLDTFVNLLFSLRQVHFKAREPLVLCDIKPDNLMLRLPGAEEVLDEEAYLGRLAVGAYRPVFVDVGCAQLKSQLERQGGQTGELIGTPLYLPPESVPTLSGGQVKLGTYSRATDVYSLTLTCYELLTNARPYAQRGLYELSGNDLLLELFELKRGGASPIHEPALVAAVGEEPAQLFMELFSAGLASRPENRASAAALAKLCTRLFCGEETGVSGEDLGGGLTWIQTYFERRRPEDYAGA